MKLAYIYIYIYIYIFIFIKKGIAWNHIPDDKHRHIFPTSLSKTRKLPPKMFGSVINMPLRSIIQIDISVAVVGCLCH